MFIPVQLGRVVQRPEPRQVTVPPPEKQLSQAYRILVPSGTGNDEPEVPPCCTALATWPGSQQEPVAPEERNTLLNTRNY